MKKLLTALLIAALTTAASGALALSFDLDDEASEIALIQSALETLGFYYGDITEHYGARTQRGVRLFQEEYGLEATGVADDTTRALLYEVTGTVPPAVSDALLEMNITLRRGDSGSEVTWLQESLTELGFYSGEITGSYGSLTQEAVRLFQRGSGLSSDGVAGRNTIRALAQAMERKLLSELAEQMSAAGLPAQDADLPQITDPETITTLSLGVKNSAVRQLQEDLTELGFYTGEITGSFGRLTKEAVRLFQRANDIPSDGVAGPITLAEIAEEMEDLRALEEALAAPTPTPTPTPQPQATPDRYNGLVEFITPRPAATAAPRPLTGVNASLGFLSIERELKLYDSSEDVRQLQLALGSLGYYSGESTGLFDLKTQAAVMGYQAAKGLSVSGAADKITLITINDDIFRRVAGTDVD